jgi:hypothetical protein
MSKWLLDSKKLSNFGFEGYTISSFLLGINILSPKFISILLLNFDSLNEAG